MIEGGFANDTRLYAIWKKDFSGCTMSISPTSYSYSGSSDSYPITSVEKPTVTVTDPDGAPMT